MTVLTVIAEIIGFAILGIIAALVIAMAVHVVHDVIRARFPRYDLWFYDDVRRWNRRRRRRGPPLY